MSVCLSASLSLTDGVKPPSEEEHYLTDGVKPPSEEHYLTDSVKPPSEEQHYLTDSVKSPSVLVLGLARKLPSVPLSINSRSASNPVMLGWNHL